MSVSCLFFGQLIFVIASMNSFASEVESSYYDVLGDEYFRARSTASYRPTDEMIYSPFTEQSNTWLDQVMVDDEDKTLAQMRQTIQNWEQMEEYSRMWNLESSGLYQTPLSGEKMNYLSKNMIRYIDKRIAGEVKNAKEGSTLKKIGEIQENLRPSAQIAIGQRVKMKIRMHILQGQASMSLLNPWIDMMAEGTASGKLKLCLDKHFSQIGGQAALNYEYHYNKWTASYEQLITNNLKARLASEKTGNLSLRKQDQQNIQLIYWRAF